MNEKKKVLFLINSLKGGGAERVLVNLVNNLDYSKYDITIQTMFKAGVNKQFLSDSVKLIEGKTTAPKGISKIIKLAPPFVLEKFVSKDNYDVVVAYMHGAPTKLLWKYSDRSSKKVAWLHCDMNISSLPKIFSKEEVISCFGTYDRIVGVSKSVCDSFEENYGLADKLQVIYNTNDTNKILSMANEQVNDFSSWINFDGIRLITVGRLNEQKGFDRLIRVCKQLKADGKIFKLLILGQGPEEENLTKIINENSLSDEVILGGFNKNPYPYIKMGDLFVCSSRYEGLSTVMSEAILLGTPVISTDVSGAEEVLGKDNEYGIIVENSEEALYEGLSKTVSNRDLIDYYRKKAIERAPFFDMKNTVGSVEKLIDELCS